VTARPGRWTALLAIVAAGCAWHRAPEREALPVLMVPVAGVAPADVPDGFRAPRPGGRIHGAVDIPAPRGTPVVSADDGRVLRRRRNAKGGLTLYATDARERFVYYYAHLDGYRAGIDKGSRLVRGEVIGVVGATGNADAREPHLHFQVMRRPGDGRWWSGEPIDPRPLFTRAGAIRVRPK